MTTELISMVAEANKNGCDFRRDLKSVSVGSRKGSGRRRPEEERGGWRRKEEGGGDGAVTRSWTVQRVNNWKMGKEERRTEEDE